MSPDHGYFADLGELPSWHQYFLAAQSLVRSLDADDPDDTLFVQLTFSEVVTITMGLLTLGRVFPELTGCAVPLSEKLKEVATEQDFLKRPPKHSEDDE